MFPYRYGAATTVTAFADSGVKVASALAPLDTEKD